MSLVKCPKKTLDKAKRSNISFTRNIRMTILTLKFDNLMNKYNTK